MEGEGLEREVWGVWGWGCLDGLDGWTFSGVLVGGLSKGWTDQACRGLIWSRVYVGRRSEGFRKGKGGGGCVGGGS